ncbi:MAG: hypothetical protein HY600_02765 [Candidatus Omnitrophica bacterium]|nr:hypothetical protein [Candidatus Omnitrophota bacterium]
MPRRAMRYPRLLCTLLIFSISIGLVLPSPAVALRAGVEGRERTIAAGLEERIAPDVNIENTPVGVAKYDGRVWTEPVVRQIVFTERGAPLRRASFDYDEYAQLKSLTLEWSGPPAPVPERVIPLGDGRAFHFAYGADGVPKAWIERPGEPPWLFSGYDLVERAPSGRSGTATALSHVTISHYRAPDGRVIPASESVDHDEMVPFLETQRFPGGETTVINHDFHTDNGTMTPDAHGDDYGGPAGPVKETLRVGNWVSFVAARQLASELIWAAPPHMSIGVLFRPRRDSTTADYDVETSNLQDVSPRRRYVVATYDFDYFSCTETMLAATGSYIASMREITNRVSEVVTTYLHKGIKFSAVNFTRSALIRKSFFDYSPPEQSNLILNALVHEHRRLLGEPILKKVPVSESPLFDGGRRDFSAAGLEENEQTALEQHLRRVASGTPRFLTGETGSYDVLAKEILPHTLAPELAGGLSPLLGRFETAGAPYTWVDGAVQFGAALKEAEASGRYPRLRTVAVDLVPWTRSDVGGATADNIEAEAQARGLTPARLWSTEAFIREDLGRVRLPQDAEAPIRLLTVFHALSFNQDPLRILAHLYNQLPDGAYLLANLYVPIGYDPGGVSEGFRTADEVVAFWRDRLPAALKAHGIPMEVRVTDDRLVSVQEYHLGLVLQKTPGALELTLTAHAKPVTVQTLRRPVEYQLVWYTGDLDHPFRDSAAGLEATAQPTAPVRPPSALDSQL